jgi:L-2-hydroxyglutarate oxidase LhgO
VKTFDFTVIGGGIIGICVAVELKKFFSDSKIAVLEKEEKCGLHASGRNSGVLHAGFYYSSDSLKAKFCSQGNRALREYCQERKLPVNKCGKLVVSKNEQEIEGLNKLYKNGLANGVDLKMISEKEAREIEPRVKTCQKAIFSPTTCTIDPQKVMEELVRDAINMGIVIETETQYVSRNSGNKIKISKGDIETGYVINAGGVYADRIARDFDFSKNYRILPFKGIYLYSSQSRGSIRTNVYPVPDLNFPFLGVHWTVTVDGRNKIGPTAIPAFWREHYQGFENFNPGEMLQIVATEISLFFKAGFDFRGLAMEEIKKYSKRILVQKASELMGGVKLPDYSLWGKPGIRAQLFDINKRNLVMDFCLEGDDKSFHILNAVSPAFTCAIPFARYVVEQICVAVGAR